MTEWMTVEEVASHAKVSAKTVRKWVRCRVLVASLTPGGRWRIRREDVDSLFKPAPALDGKVETSRER